MKTFAAQRVQLVGNQLERRSLDGREYAVVPTVVIVEGVLNGGLVPLNEITACVTGWNGRPIPVRHPTDDKGEYTSANDPAVIEANVVGQLFGAQVIDDRLAGEMWLDVVKIEALGGDALLALQRLEAGEVVEVSSGYFCDIEATSGEFKGKRYHEIHRNLVPDHVALLPDEIGACSVVDGCGAGRYNRQGDNVTRRQGDRVMRTNQDSNDSVMIAFFLRAEDAGVLALGDAPDGVEVIPASELHVTLAYLGSVEDMLIDQATLLQWVADYARYQVALPVTVCGHGRFLNAGLAEDGEGMDPVFALVESERLHQLRHELVEYIGYMVPVSRAYGFLPHITLAYAPAGVEVPLAGVQRRDLVFDALAVSWGGATVMFQLQGQVREGQVNEKDQAKVEPKVKKANEEGQAEGQTQGQGESQAQDQGTANPVVQLAEAVAAFGGMEALLAAINGLKANSEQQRAGLIGQIKANRNNAFSDGQLQAMGLEALQALARTLTPANYGGQAAGVFNAAQDEEWGEYQAPKA